MQPRREVLGRPGLRRAMPREVRERTASAAKPMETMRREELKRLEVRVVATPGAAERRATVPRSLPAMAETPHQSPRQGPMANLAPMGLPVWASARSLRLVFTSHRVVSGAAEGKRVVEVGAVALAAGRSGARVFCVWVARASPVVEGVVVEAVPVEATRGRPAGGAVAVLESYRCSPSWRCWRRPSRLKAEARVGEAATGVGAELVARAEMPGPVNATLAIVLTSAGAMERRAPKEVTAAMAAARQVEREAPAFASSSGVRRHRFRVARAYRPPLRREDPVEATGRSTPLKEQAGYRPI
jgi:hypothetical protein